jgi:hypothetical protein
MSVCMSRPKLQTTTSAWDTITSVDDVRHICPRPSDVARAKQLNRRPARRPAVAARTRSRCCILRNVRLQTFRCTHHTPRAYNDGMESNVFDLIDIELAGTTERVLAGFSGCTATAAPSSHICPSPSDAL